MTEVQMFSKLRRHEELEVTEALVTRLSASVNVSDIRL